MKIRKAVIPAAGLGTRFLPATKAQPKEMLPLVDKPAIQYIVEEAIASGIESILIVTGRNKKAIEDHFDKAVELESILESKGKFGLLREVQAISDLADIHFIRQKEPLGLGHAILCAQQFIGDEPFAVLLGDDIMISEPPALSQLMKVYETEGKQVVGVKPVPREDVHKYGIISYTDNKGPLYRVDSLVEKPSPERAPSGMAVMGRYILKPSIFPALEKLEKGAGGEYQLTDALHALCTVEEMLALELQGRRYDIGDRIGYLKATLEIGLRREDLRVELLSYLRELTVKGAIPS
jgi:UTP--glucose-1-phosphate uridylyltransferase